MEEKKFDSTSFSEAIRKANEALDSAAEVRWSEDVSELVFAWPKRKWRGLPLSNASSLCC